MKENGLSVRPRRRFIATTDSAHDGPIFPNLAKNIVPTNLNQLWVADITYIAIATGFVYLARDPRRLVTASCRPCDRQADRCTFGDVERASPISRHPSATRNLQREDGSNPRQSSREADCHANEPWRPHRSRHADRRAGTQKR